MNVTVIYGTMKKANTYNCVQLLLNNLSVILNIKVTEFFLPGDFPLSCKCFPEGSINNIDICLDVNYIHSITDSLTQSDLIILACPVLNCDITANLKLLLNTLHYKSIEDNTISFMKNKIGLVMSTSTGAGLFHSTEMMKKNLDFWGINNICKFSKTLYEMNWDYVTLKTKLKINKRILKLSNKIIGLYIRTHITNVPISNQITSLNTKSIFENNRSNVLYLCTEGSTLIKNEH